VGKKKRDYSVEETGREKLCGNEKIADHSEQKECIKKKAKGGLWKTYLRDMVTFGGDDRGIER